MQKANRLPSIMALMANVTTENQKRADERLPILINTPAKHRGFMAAPYIGPVDADAYGFTTS